MHFPNIVIYSKISFFPHTQNSLQLHVIFLICWSSFYSTLSYRAPHIHPGISILIPSIKVSFSYPSINEPVPLPYLRNHPHVGLFYIFYHCFNYDLDLVCISSFVLILFAKISATRMNRKAETGHPCLIPHSISHDFEIHPLFLYFKDRFVTCIC